ncbi:hypothetical protein LTR94_029293, partial [Friedmanniomyces endolithicus]
PGRLWRARRRRHCRSPSDRPVRHHQRQRPFRGRKPLQTGRGPWRRHRLERRRHLPRPHDLQVHHRTARHQGRRGRGPGLYPARRSHPL